jgi:hypothetical protein
MKDLCWTLALGHVLSPVPVVIQPVHPFIIREADTNKPLLRPHEQRTLRHHPPLVQIIIIIIVILVLTFVQGL